MRQAENPTTASVKTVERAIEHAFLKTGLLLEGMDYDTETKNPKFDFLRCSRTDKGVHAAFNCVSLKLRFHPRFLGEGFSLADYENKGQYKHLLDREQVIRELNQAVDPDIKFFGRID